MSAAELALHPLALALFAGLAQHRDALLQAPPGTGKSTLVPLALLTAAGTQGGKLLMLEPRRVAARAVAARMASLLQESVGATVGYRMRLDTRVSQATRIEVITEGVLTRLLQEDPALEGVDWLIFDEFHERSLQADLGLALALDAREQLGAAFRVLIMSATLEANAVAPLLGDAALVSASGAPFEVHIHYLGRGLPLLPSAPASGPAAVSGRTIEMAVCRAVQRAAAESSGDVLVFLPGAGEIQRVDALLRESGLTPQFELLPLHGQLPGEAQDAALAPPARPKRRVVLATNVAETSLTVPGVTAVVDSGLVRRAHFDPVTGMSRLELTRISRASSEQRAGRAGRLAPGVCYRLWSQGGQDQLIPHTPAEILEADLAPLALDLARWGINDATRLRWLDAPPAPALAQARELLQRLEALDACGRLTAIGQEMARLAVHPRLAHMLLRAREFDAVSLAAQLAALLSERDLLRGERDPDVRSRLELLEQGPRGSGAERIRRSARALERAAREVRLIPKAASGEQLAGLEASALPGALLALAYPDRIGQRREGAAGRYLLANGRGAAFIGPTALARAPFIVAVALDDRAREAMIELAAPLAGEVLEILFSAQIEWQRTSAWDEELGAVQLRESRRLGALVLEERRSSLEDAEQSIPIVLQWLQRRGIASLPWDTESRELQSRLQFVRGLGLSECADWPASDDATLAATLPQWLAPFLSGVSGRDQVARLPLRQALLARLSPPQQRTLDRLAPQELPLPRGRRGRLDYSNPQGPSLSVRLQDAFGMEQTPRVGGGAVPVTLVLLSPARRPVQVTRDLAGFWRGSYAEVRKQLRGRYPKHAWPENPVQQRGGLDPPKRGGGKGSKARR